MTLYDPNPTFNFRCLKIEMFTLKYSQSCLIVFILKLGTLRINYIARAKIQT